MPMFVHVQKAWALQGIEQLPYDPLPPLPSAEGEMTCSSSF